MRKNLFMFAAAMVALQWSQVIADETCQYRGASPETYFSAVPNTIPQKTYVPQKKWNVVGSKLLEVKTDNSGSIQPGLGAMTSWVASFSPPQSSLPNGNFSSPITPRDLNDEEYYLTNRLLAFHDGASTLSPTCRGRFEHEYYRAKEKQIKDLMQVYKDVGCAALAERATRATIINGSEITQEPVPLTNDERAKYDHGRCRGLEYKMNLLESGHEFRKPVADMDAEDIAGLIDPFSTEPHEEPPSSQVATVDIADAPATVGP